MVKIRYLKLDEKRRKWVVSRVKDFFKKKKRIKLVFWFGSSLSREYARDIDIAIYAVPRLEFDELLKLGSELEFELKIPVDLVQLSDLNPAFRLKILQHGKPILDNGFGKRLIPLAYSELCDLKLSKKSFK